MCLHYAVYGSVGTKKKIFVKQEKRFEISEADVEKLPKNSKMAFGGWLFEDGEVHYVFL